MHIRVTTRHKWTDQGFETTVRVIFETWVIRHRRGRARKVGREAIYSPTTQNRITQHYDMESNYTPTTYPLKIRKVKKMSKLSTFSLPYRKRSGGP